jgi:sulfate permease, SulP family
MAEATLGAVVVVAVLGLLDLTVIHTIAAVRLRGAVLALVTVAGFSCSVCSAVCCSRWWWVVSILTLMHSVNTMPIRVLGRERASGLFLDIDREPGAGTTPGLLILKPEGGLYFANARRVFERMKALVLATYPRARVLLIDMSAVPDMEVTAVLLVEELDRDLAALGVELWMCAIVEAVDPKVPWRATERGAHGNQE